MRTHRQTAQPSGATLFARTSVGQTFRRTAIGIGAAVAASLTLPALAQQQAIVMPGFAAVTGYSGFVAYPAPDGADPSDYMTINTDGPAARVVDLTNPGPQGVLSPAPKPFTVTAGQVGQVFGVTLDNAPQPNIYLAATSAYGLSIYLSDDSGNLKRIRQGAPDAQFVPGQFGPPELGGGSGSIWRVSGVTGEVSLLATIDSGSGSLAGLGGLAFDPASQQIFVAERGTGMIYRLALDGTIKGVYDHGVEGRPGAGLAPVPMAMALPVDIGSPAFDTGNPATWGFAAPARRVFALAVYNKRLYYSISQGPQIWSAGISASGAIPGNDARIEVEVPSLQDGVEIASIAFDGQGRMYLAERGATTGDYFLYQLANAGQSRVLRYLPKPAGDPAPGRWKLLPEQYSVGFPPVYNNADGGVALNYGYNQSGKINPGACGATVWSTGDRLLDPGDGSTPDMFDAVDGLQGNAIPLVQPQNVPPTAAWFIDYDDQAGDPNFHGYMGAIATIRCAGQAPKPPPPAVTCPQGTYFYNGQCLIYPECPQGTEFQNGQCVYPQCPQGFVLQKGKCVPPGQSCPQGTVFYQGQCVPLDCPPGLERLPNGFCACPQGTIYANGQCLPPNSCPPGGINLGGICICPLGLILQNGQCNPFECPQGQIMSIEGKCEPINCPPGQEVKGNQCVPIKCKPNQDLFNGKCVAKCPPNKMHTMPNGVCGPILCGFPLVPFNGQCVDACPPKQHHTMPNGACVPNFVVVDPGLIDILCLAPLEPYNGKCVAKCPPNQVHTGPNGVCKPKFVIDPGLIEILCLAPLEPYNGKCVAKCPPNQVHTGPNGVCKPKFVIDPGLIEILCLAPLEPYNGKCVAKCPPNQIHTGQNGACKPKFQVIDPGLIQILCLAPKEMVNGDCVPPCPPNTVRKPNGSCGPKFQVIDPGLIQIMCLSPKELVNDQCVDPCPPNTVRKPDGTCGPKFLQLLPKLELQINP